MDALRRPGGGTGSSGASPNPRSDAGDVYSWGFVTGTVRAVIRFEFEARDSRRVTAITSRTTSRPAGSGRRPGVTYRGDRLGPDLESDAANPAGVAVDGVDQPAATEE